MRHKILRAAVGFLLAANALTGPSLAATLHLAPLPQRESEPSWQGSQFVVADKAGHVYFLRSPTLEIYPLTKEGFLGEPSRLKKAPGLSDEVRGAAMSPAGNLLLLRVSKAVRLFEDGKEKIVAPLEWSPMAVAFRRDTPTVAVAPLPVGPLQDASKIGTLPWLQQLDGERWTTFREREGPTLAELMKEDNWFGKILEQDPLSLASDRRGRLWVAHRYAYKVQQFSPSGRILSEILLDQGKVRKKREAQPVEIKPSASANPREATHAPSQEKSTFFPFTAEAVIQGLAEGRDGRMYFLVVPASGGAALDRYDPVRGVMERALLDWKVAGDLSIAAGKDGLYVAPMEATKGRWRISWETLEQAKWKEIEGVTLESQQLAAFPGEATSAGDRRHDLIRSVELPRPSFLEGMEEVRILSNLRYNEGNEIAVGGARRRRQALSGGINEAGTTRFEALLEEPAAVPCPSPRD